MKPFLGDDFLLDTDTACRLYHVHAAPQGIIDYHCHLPPGEIAQNRRFGNMAQIWLEGDHYKWRAMRAAAVPEHFITGEAGEREKYDAWAHVVPQTLGNPLYVWTHLELQRPFGIRNTLFGPATAPAIWDRTAALLAQDDYSARGIIQRMNVRMIGTTDDPVDDLAHHAALAQSDLPVRVLPSFRPDRAFKIDLPGFPDYIAELREASGIDIGTIEELFQALSERMDHFAAHGCCIADHGIETVRFAEGASAPELDRIMANALRGRVPDAEGMAQFSTAVLLFLGREYARRDWVMQYHIGAQRDNNARRFRQLGPNTGFDSIGDRPYAQPLASLLSALDEQDQLPRTILYGINPASNDVLATMTGNFQGGETAGKVQYGSAWWFNDQHDGMLRQLTALAQHSLLSRFVGMLTDSRSFLSYTRHEYFRRILCALLGRWVENGELPDEPELLGRMVEYICFNNANRYFNLDL